MILLFTLTRYYKRMQDKHSLRKGLAKKRSVLSEDEVKRASQIIAGQVFERIDWHEITSVHCYEALGSLREIDPRPLLRLIADLPHPPRVTLGDTSPSAKIPEGTFDVIIVPTVGFDAHNFRLGQGGGWYDRFLSKQPGAITVGLAYHWSEVAFRHEPHDIPLSLVITDV